MKRIYLLSLWLLACLVLPLQGQAVSQAELLNSDRYHMSTLALTLVVVTANTWISVLLKL